uniref:Cysteine-rich protein 2 n=1 Tax=Oryzias latipes TaxID=8090 RepID=A0A3P9JNM7_ORYLA
IPDSHSEREHCCSTKHCLLPSWKTEKGKWVCTPSWYTAWPKDFPPGLGLKSPTKAGLYEKGCFHVLLGKQKSRENKYCCAEKVSSLGKDWHKLCLKCDRCNKLLNAGGHAEHDGRPYCHKPCYAALFGPKGVNIGGAGSYVYDAPANNNAAPTAVDSAAKVEDKRVCAPKVAPKAAGSITTFSGEANLCPRCHKKVYFAEKVTSLGKDWHRPCLRCERCSKTLAAGSHAEHDGQPYCHKPCYAVLFGPKGVNTGGVGSYIYDKEPSAVTQP